MIKSIEFKNFKILRDATLPLGPFTLLVGPNGSGKSTAIQGLTALWRGRPFDEIVSVAAASDPSAEVAVSATWLLPWDGVKTVALCRKGDSLRRRHQLEGVSGGETGPLDDILRRVRAYALQASEISADVLLQPRIEMASSGGGLAGVLDRLRDQHPERFEALNEELGRWIPEFDRLLFETPAEGNRRFGLRTRRGHHTIRALDLSQGTLLALAILTLAYLADPPSIVCLEEPDRGIHPRLLRDVRDAIYRLSYPQDFGEDRKPVQVIATTHSPYMLDLFKDHLDEIVVCEKLEDNVRFTRLSELPHVEEILEESRLGDAWYTGILGGVPADR